MRSGLIAALVLVLASVAPAQTTRPAEGLGVHLLTMGPGPAVWERFGHNAIAVIDRDSGANLAYNYGVFDFDDADFIVRFMRGDMRYWVESADTSLMISPYVHQDRDVWGQELSLSPEQARALHDFLETNVLPANKHYTYNYYTDNCSTRVRDAIDRATGGQVRRQLESVQTGNTYRQHTRAAMAGSPAMAFGIDFSLSAYADRHLNAWDDSFLPVQLMEHLRRVNLAHDAGGRPLVAVDRRLHTSQTASLRVPEHPPSRWGTLLALGVGFGIVMLIAGRSARWSKSARVVAAVLWAGWGLIAGLGGWYLLLMWTATNHRAAYANENLLQASPLAIAMVLLGPLAAFGKARKITIVIAMACAAMALLGLASKALPAFVQDNWNVLALTLPLNAALAASVFLRNRASSGAPRN